MAVNLDRVRELVNLLHAELNNGSTTTPPPVLEDESWRNEPGFPKLKTINGATFDLLTPLNPKYIGSVTDQVLGSQGAHIHDPASPQGARSPAGWPTVNGKPQYAGNVFEDDAAVQAYLDASAAQPNHPFPTTPPTN